MFRVCGFVWFSCIYLHCLNVFFVAVLNLIFVFIFSIFLCDVFFVFGVEGSGFRVWVSGFGI